MLVLWLFVQEWITETSYRAWLLFAGLAPLSYAVQLVWHHAVRASENWNNIVVAIDSMRAATLFRAVADCIEQVAEANNETCSCDTEAFTEYDKTRGTTQVRMCFWGKKPRVVNLKMAAGRRFGFVFGAFQETSAKHCRGPGTQPVEYGLDPRMANTNRENAQAKQWRWA